MEMHYLYILLSIAGGTLFGALLVALLKQKKIAALKEQLLENASEWIVKQSVLEKEQGLLTERLQYAQNTLEKSTTNEKELEYRIESLVKRVAIANTERENLEQKLHTQKEELEKLEQRFKTEFENIANKILKRNSEEFTQFNRKNIDEILNPLKDKITAFEKRVEETYDKEMRDKISLREEVKKLYELNTKISDEAHSLTKALKGDVKKQGNWGELVLEKILERSGLQKGQEYERELVMDNEEGKRIRPDVIINLPDEKHIIIDSKVSLIDYERSISADNEEERKLFAKAHVESLKRHIKELASKHYQTSATLNTPDFVLMFIPVESSFALAVQEDGDLFNLAWDNKIVLVSPSTLLATLRTVASIWKQEKQNRNVMEIARQGGELYNKFVGFMDDLVKVGQKLDGAKKQYEDSMNKLFKGSGNLVRRAENIRKLGAKVKKELPQNIIDRMEKE